MTSRLLPSTSRNEGVTGSIDQTKADIATLRQQYTKLILWEEKCIWFDKKQPQSKIHIPFHRWQALLAIHKHLLQEHEHFFSMSQMPSARAAIRDVPYDYAMFNRMWRYGIYSPLELLHQNLPGSLGPMLHFIYHVSSTLNRFLEFDPALGVILYEQQGDVTRYHMAAQRQHRKHLAGISRYWYRKAADQNPNLVESNILLQFGHTPTLFKDCFILPKHSLVCSHSATAGRPLAFSSTTGRVLPFNEIWPLTL